MRKVPESIKLALEDASLPVKKRILMYRRVWNADELKYALESTPVDVTDLLVAAGSIKMALDTDEVDKWDASNVTLTFNNDLNCFKEGLKGGLFENAVLWGSKLVYNIETADTEETAAGITVFTGYIYSSPVFRENGNQIELTVTSSLDALEYVSAEGFCLSKTDEPAAEEPSSGSRDKGKTFITAHTGVGYVDTVKYGTDYATAQTLSGGRDYDVSQTNEYAEPAKVELKIPPVEGGRMWVSYRYWHKDLVIDDIVNALLDLAGVEKRSVEKAVFTGKNFPLAYSYLGNSPRGSFLQVIDADDTHPAVCTASPVLLGEYGVNGSWTYGGITFAKGTNRREYPFEKNEADFLFLADKQWWDDGKEDVRIWEGVVDEDGNGLCIGRATGMYYFANPKFLNDRDELKGSYYLTRMTPFAGFSVSKDGEVYVYEFASGQTKLTRFYWGKMLFKPAKVCRAGWKYSTPYKREASEILIRNGVPTDRELAEQTIMQLFSRKQDFTLPLFWFEPKKESGFVKWGSLSGLVTAQHYGKGNFYVSESADGVTYSALRKINLGENLGSSADYIRIWYRLESPYDCKTFVHSLAVSQYLYSFPVSLVNLSDLTVGEAIAQLAKMVSYEIGFNQEGVFFFRSRQGRYTDAVLAPDKLVASDNHTADIDSLSNRVTVEYGHFKTTVDDFTEGKPRPSSIDTYGVHAKNISDDNFVPADNVDISRAVAKANYENLCVPGYTLQADCRPDLSLELGDKITVCSENTDMGDKNWSDYAKFLKLPVWKRVFKVVGIELAFDKRLMTLDLKDVTSDNDVPPMQYNVYQTHFPTKLDFKE